MIREAIWMMLYSGHILLHKQVMWRKDLAAWRRYWTSYRAYRRLAPSDNLPRLRNLTPCLGDDTAETTIEPIYFYQDSWAFGKIVQQKPHRHVDVGSQHKFVALLSKVLPVTMVDIRPLSLPLDSLNFQEGSILDMPFDDDALMSVSSMCVVEHIGLGRYGDPLDAQGTEKAVAELKRIVAPGGDLYLSVPIDSQNRIYFNAHRAFSEPYFESLLYPFEIRERRYIHGTRFSADRGSGYCIGCYHVRKPAQSTRPSEGLRS